MPQDVTLDEVDRTILRLLVENGRRSTVDIATRVRLSPAPVKRRIDRLERLGVISGYTAIVDETRVGGFDAFTELRFGGDTPVAEFIQAVTGQPEVLEVLTIAGDPDALVRIRVDNVQHLQQVVDGLRRTGRVVGTKTLVVLSSWRRGDGTVPTTE
ncbi:Lrp/AsnC family transcriptional regulator [Streptomyces sp. NPDC051677]|uniref:Lrp/AsnC family transcriptional regulator n=1 Tax=Streptomyces sp. NPDC051677 TaxID=3365669 RepID=UPI0037CE9CD3